MDRLEDSLDQPLAAEEQALVEDRGAGHERVVLAAAAPVSPHGPETEEGAGGSHRQRDQSDEQPWRAQPGPVVANRVLGARRQAGGAVGPNLDRRQPGRELPLQGELSQNVVPNRLRVALAGERPACPVTEGDGHRRPVERDTGQAKRGHPHDLDPGAGRLALAEVGETDCRWQAVAALGPQQGSADLPVGPLDYHQRPLVACFAGQGAIGGAQGTLETAGDNLRLGLGEGALHGLTSRSLLASREEATHELPRLRVCRLRSQHWLQELERLGTVARLGCLASPRDCLHGGWPVFVPAIRCGKRGSQAVLSLPQQPGCLRAASQSQCLAEQAGGWR